MKNNLLTIVAVVMTIIATTAQAQADARISSTARYVLDTVPVPVTVAEAHRCAQAYYNGGTYRLLNEKITLTCTKHVIRKEWDPKN